MKRQVGGNNADTDYQAQSLWHTQHGQDYSKSQLPSFLGRYTATRFYNCQRGVRYTRPANLKNWKG